MKSVGRFLILLLELAHLRAEVLQEKNLLCLTNHSQDYFIVLKGEMSKKNEKKSLRQYSRQIMLKD